MEKLYEKFTNSHFSKYLPMIAVVLSVISIVFSGFTLFNSRDMHHRYFRMQKRYETQSNMRDDFFKPDDFERGPHNGRYFGKNPSPNDNFNCPNNCGRNSDNNDFRFNKPNDFNNSKDSEKKKFGKRNGFKSNNNDNDDLSRDNSKQQNSNGPVTAPEIFPQ